MTVCCEPLPPLIPFNFAAFTSAFPAFAGVPTGVAEFAFKTAGLYFVNTAQNPAFCSGNMETLLWLLTAHILTLRGYPVASGTTPTPSGMVGRINSATEGSVSVGSEWTGSGSPTEPWYLQTQYGAMFWAATAQYRTFRYVANPTVVWHGLNPAANTYRGR